MKSVELRIAIVVMAAMSLLCAPLTMGQDRGERPEPLDPSIKRTFVPLAVPMALYEPLTPGEKSHIGIYVQHAGLDFTTHFACTELSKRGYTVLCAAGPNAQLLDEKLLKAKSGVAFLRQFPGIRQVVLFGHSGGATLMSAYQLVAENGPTACQGPNKLIKCSDNLAGLPAADGVILADANWGVMALFSLDPAVVRNDSGMTVDPDLDLFNSKNGFTPEGASYSREFVDKYQSAVAKKENELIAAALGRLALIEAGKGRFADDEPFLVAGGSGSRGNNKLFAQDPRLMSHTRKPWPLLHADGSVTTEIVHTVRVPSNLESRTPFVNSGAANTTVRGFLSGSAIRVTEDFGYDESTVHGVEWTSSYSSTPGNVEGITVPLLLMGMTGGWEYLAHETIYEHAKSSDKTLVFVEGATHGHDTCKECEATPGQYGDTVKTIYDCVDRWLGEKGRFVSGD